MAKTIQMLREERKAKAAEVLSNVEKHQGAWGGKDGENQKNHSRLAGEIMDLDLAIENMDAAIQLAAAEKPEPSRVTDGDRKRHPLTRDVVVDAFYRQGIANMSPEQRDEFRKLASIERPMDTMTTTGATEGVELVPGLFGRLVEKQLWHGGMREDSSQITTSNGQAIPFPQADSTAQTGEIVGQNVGAADLDMVFATARSLPTFVYSSKAVTCPQELIQDAGMDIEGYISQRLQVRLSRKQNADFTVGTGTTLPEGAVVASLIGRTGASGQTASVLYSDLIKLEHSVNMSYRAGGACKFMLNDLTLRDLKEMVDGQDRPIWLPGYATNAPASILGYGYQINNDVVVQGVSAKSILFGDFSQYLIRDVVGVSVLRLTDSTFSLKHQVGFVAFQRSGGLLLDPNAIRHYINAAS